MTARFATTQWSLVRTARDGSDTEARQALEALCQTYWHPLYAFVRSQGHDPDSACDITQAYFAELLEKNFLSAVQSSAGRFRHFLLASLKHFMSHERDKAGTLKRGGGTRTVSLDSDHAEQRLRGLPVDRLTPEEIFERQWAMTLIERALERLHREAVASNTATHFEHLRVYLTGEASHPPYREVAAELGMSEGAVRTAVSRLRKRFGRMLRAEILDTIADPTEADDEIRHLLTVIRPWQGATP